MTHKHNHAAPVCNRLFIRFATILLVMGIFALTACTDKKAADSSPTAAQADTAAVQNSVSASGQSEDAYMKAPEVKADANGLLALNGCPTQDAHLSVALSVDNDKAVISYDGKPLQTVSDEDGLVAAGGDKTPVYFLDANFDGFTDIFIGPGESRTYSTLLIWDPAARQFARIGTLGEPMLQGFMLEPATSSVIQGGSGSYCMFQITRSKWDGQSLKQLEELTIVSDSEQYGEYEVNAKYTVKDAQGNAVVSTDEKSQLPQSWQNIIAKYEVE